MNQYLKKKSRGIIPGILITIVGIIVLLLLVAACDHLTPRTKFVLAVPKSDASYWRAANHIKQVLETGGFDIELMPVQTSQEAAELVAIREADLCLVMNKSVSIAEALGDKATRLRTVLPLFDRAMFFYTKQDSAATAISPEKYFSHKTIGIETADGETQVGLQGMLDRAEVKEDYTIKTDSNTDIRLFWASNFAPQHLKLKASGWHPLSLDKNWITFICANNPALLPITVPALPGKKDSKEINTAYSETILLASTTLGENAVYTLAKYIYQNKVHFLTLDRMYQSINEGNDAKNLLFALHPGADAYLRRDHPSFLERYSDIILLFAALMAFSYAVVQAIRSRAYKMNKDQIDKYFLEFLDIKSNIKFNNDAQAALYNALFKNVLTKMTEGKMETADFHIMSRLIQEELVILKTR